MTQKDLRHVEWIQADIDGQATRQERSALRHRLETDPEARRTQAELQEICRALDEVEDIDPPPGLRSEILAEVRKRTLAKPRVRRFRAWKPPASFFRYAYLAAAGIAVGFAINEVAFRQGPDPMSPDIVGTMTAIDRDPHPNQSTAMIDPSGKGIGSLKLRASGSAVLLEVDLNATGPVEILVNYDEELMRFKGWDPRPDDGGAITAEPGLLRLKTETRRLYEIRLERKSPGVGALAVQAIMSGETVYRKTLTLPAAGPLSR